LVFSESQFLRPRQPPQVSHTPGAKSPEASSSIFGPARSRQPSNSRFFPPKLNENKQSRLSSDYSKQPSPSTALKKPPPAAAKQNRSTYTTSIINRPRDIQALFAQQQRQASASPRQDQHQIREEQLPTQRNKDKDYPTVPNNKSTCSTSSLESIQRLLKECQQPPESSCTSNSYHPYENQQQVPYYSHARSPPDQITRTYAAVSDYYKPWSPNIVFYNPDTATLDNNHPSPEEDDDHSSENAQAPNNAMRDLPFGLNWQVLDSVASFHPANNYPNHQQKKKDDLDLILASPAMRMVNRSNENEDDNLQNFWLTQSYKRKL
jgi:hypothetical protein